MHPVPSYPEDRGALDIVKMASGPYPCPHPQGEDITVEVRDTRTSDLFAVEVQSTGSVADLKAAIGNEIGLHPQLFGSRVGGSGIAWFTLTSKPRLPSSLDLTRGWKTFSREAVLHGDLPRFKPMRTLPRVFSLSLGRILDIQFPEEIFSPGSIRLVPYLFDG